MIGPLKTKAAIFLVPAVLSAALTSPAEGDIALTAHDGPDIAFDINFSYSSTHEDSAAITLALGNPVGNYPGASITGFAFNAPTGFLTSLDTDIGGDCFTGKLSYDSIKAGPYGSFDIGASNGKNFKNTVNGGKPRRGITVGDSKIFLLAFEGTGLDTLSEMDFLGSTSAGNHGQPFVVRWQDAIADRSGFAIAAVAQGDPSVVPLPGSLMLCGIGLGFITTVRRLRGKRQP